MLTIKRGYVREATYPIPHEPISPGQRSNGRRYHRVQTLEFHGRFQGLPPNTYGIGQRGEHGFHYLKGNILLGSHVVWLKEH